MEDLVTPVERRVAGRQEQKKGTRNRDGAKPRTAPLSLIVH
jgi:hypothetical protein